MAFYDLKGDRFIYEHASGSLFAGASTTKILTCAAALHALGEDHRFETRVVRTGDIDHDGTLHGDLVLVASGDPNLSGRINERDELDFCDFDHSLAGEGFDTGVVERDPLLVINELAEQITRAGIRRIQGSVAVDLAAFPDAGPEPGTAVMISSIAVNDNLVDLTFTGANRESNAVAMAVSPQTSYVRFVNRLVTAASDSSPAVRVVDGRREANSRVVEVVGSVPRDRTVRGMYIVPEPASFAASALTDALSRRGVQIDGATKTVSSNGEASVVALHRSPPLVEAVKIVLKVSQNLHAEMLARVASFGAVQELIDLLGIADEGVYQGDGCGAAGTFTPRFMCRFLAGIRRSPFADAFARALPILGCDGTLHAVQAGSSAADARAVRAKTGTMGYQNRIGGGMMVTAKALAGYITTRRSSELAFAVFVNNVPSSMEDAGQLLGEIAVAAYESF